MSTYDARVDVAALFAVGRDIEPETLQRIFQRINDEAEARGAAAPAACRKCSECDGNHHWIEDARYACKHCPATVAMCGGCDQPATKRTYDDVELCDECFASEVTS